ncbi:hypothetical protein BOFE_00950 [Candidatus Borrelia fainii]|uniref:Tyr recombinase domain-containing protein n=1 Tax=Candidatus Borrelia fainii TaxID=2518322 RepID=A0ABM8DIZ2_9SPIR|nr:site-specific integrase [Candidatus Borrelia fainii]BDU62555.1 hypothetical protein BOFE_00950 [Candidatus Borrelia fainii]
MSNEVKTIKKKYTRKIPNILEKDEINLLLDSFKITSRIQYRNKLLIKLILSTGLKISEAINLKWIDVNQNSGRIRVKKEKLSQNRTLRINPKFFAELNEMYAKFKIAKNIYLFENNNGKQLCMRVINKMLRNKSIKLGFEKRIYFDLLRYTYLTNVYKKTQNLRTVQNIAGYSSIMTSTIYANIKSKNL